MRLNGKGPGSEYAATAPQVSSITARVGGTISSRTIRRRAAVALSAITLTIIGLSGCAPTQEHVQTALQPASDTPVVLDAPDAASASIMSSQRIFASSELAFVASPEHAARFVQAESGTPVPLLLKGNGLTAELERLGVRVVAHAEGDSPGQLPDGIRTIAINPTAITETTLPKVQLTNTPAPIALYTDTSDEPALAAVTANVTAAGGTVVELPGGDPRARASIAAVREHAGSTTLALGQSFGGSERFAQRLRTAQTAPELPGGGQLVFDGQLMVASYGHPGAPVLGVLGEHDLEGAISDIKHRAAEYQALTERTVVPTFELITTIASARPGPDGDYSDEASVETLRPWVERAGQEGLYVVLDLQPGTASFPEQVVRYQELLKLPHVGLALDPEWRLKPGERHLEQIGSVEAAEVNETIAWLADFCAEHDLPQKMLIVHQFALHMIEHREQLDTSQDDVRVLIHVDGHGTPPLKMETWDTLLENLPEGTELGWKNFIDEDTPMLTPAETLQITPHPLFISYQ